MKILDMRETFIDYKKTSMYIAFPVCSLNCKNCHNKELRNKNTVELDYKTIVDYILNNPIIESVVLSGMNPMDSFDDVVGLIKELRKKSNMDVVIYSGKLKYELKKEISVLKSFSNIIVKFGEYKENDIPIYSEVLGINLASSNQYARRIEDL